MGRSWYHQNCYACRVQFENDEENVIILCKTCEKYYCLDCLNIDEMSYYLNLS